MRVIKRIVAPPPPKPVVDISHVRVLTKTDEKPGEKQ